jgi:DNA-binding CsgD family transcriptional regulator
VAISKDFLWDTIDALATELERADPQSVVAARTRGLLDARGMGLHTTDRHLANKRHYRTHDDACAELYLAGNSTYSIAAALGISVGCVVGALSRKGVEKRTHGEGQKATSRKQDEGRVDLIRARRADGKNLGEIADELHITRERVRQICVKNGISTETLLTPDQRLAVDEYVSGNSLELVAAAHGTHASTLRNWVVKAGFAVRPSPKTSKRDPETLRKAEEAEKLYRSGQTISEISVALGYGANGGGPVYRLLAIRGISPDRQVLEQAA